MAHLAHRGALTRRVRRVSVQGADGASQRLEHAPSCATNRGSMYFYSDLYQK